MSRDYFEINRISWNNRTKVHIKSKFYDVPGFKAGKSSLNFIELEALGNVAGKKLLHLQCHFGQDTLSWARLGANVTGIDLSDRAIAEAKKLADEIDVDARFICANIYDLKSHLEDEFDIVFTSYGTICWLPDLDKWAALVSHYLKPGGIFYFVDFHPFITMWDFDNYEKAIFPYFNDGSIFEEISTGTYTDGGEDLVHHDIEWGHNPAETVTALIKNGLTITEFSEYPFSVYNCFPGMIEIDKGKYVVEKFGSKAPHMYTIKAEKK